MFHEWISRVRVIFPRLRFILVWAVLWLSLPLHAEIRHLVVGCDSNYPPYEYVDAQGQPQGFNIDLIRAIAKDTGVSVEVRAGVWEDVRRWFDSGEVDVLSGLFFSEARFKHVDFSVPHSILHYAIFIRGDGSPFRSEAELGGKTILVQKSDFGDEYLRAKGFQVRPVSTPEGALRQLATGQGDCAVVPRAMGLFLIQRKFLGNLKPVGAPFLPQKYCFAVRKNHPELLSYLNEGLFMLRESGKYAEIADQHFGGLQPEELPFSLAMKRAKPVLLPVLFVLVGLGAWSWTLNRLVQQRTLSLDRELQERRKAEAALRQSEEQYRLLTENIHDFVCETDADGVLVFLNANFERVAGYRIEELLGKTWVDCGLIHADDLPRIRGRWPHISTLGASDALEFKGQNASGEWGWFDGRTNCFENARGERRVVIVSRDITEQKRTGEVLRQTQKLESLGILAGGIAHDFNNLLTAIMGNLSLARTYLPPGAEAHAFLENAEKTAIRAADLTKQMLAYSGRGHFVVKPHDLNQVVQEMTHLLNVSISKKTVLNYRLADHLSPIEADGAQLQQVVMNLVTNAADAIGDVAGAITISTREQELDEAYIASTFPTQKLRPGVYVELEVSDTGCGMDAAVMDKIFDPFFTTKSQGRGLGLSAMLGILRGHHAGIKIYSEIGKGSVFKLFFPVAAAFEVTPVKKPVEEHRALTGTVLLVDDEPMILGATGAALRALGLKVITAVDGREGVSQFQEHADEIQIVIMDLTMPRMDGIEAFQAMRAIRGDLPVILCSGYSEQESLRSLTDKRFTGFLQKPYRFADLARVVRTCLQEALDGADGRGHAAGAGREETEPSQDQDV